MPNKLDCSAPSDVAWQHKVLTMAHTSLGSRVNRTLKGYSRLRYSIRGAHTLTNET